MSCINTSSAALLSAVKKVDYAQVQKLLSKHGLPIDDKWNDYKILIHAMHTGNIKIVKLLLSYGCRVKSSKSNSCKTPLCYAVHDKNLEMVQILLEAGASIIDKDSNVNTPLYMAAESKFFTAVDLMLSKYNVENIDVTNTDEIIHFYIACIRNNVSLVKSFIRCGMDVNTCVNFDTESWPGYLPLHFAVEYECVEVVELLLSYGAEYTFLNAKKMSPLHIAFCLEDSQKKFEIMDYIIFLHNTNATNPADALGTTHFHIACTRYNTEAVKNFLKSGVAVNTPTAYNAYPLHMATMKNRDKIVEILLKHGASLNIKFNNSTPLHVAIKKQFTTIAKLLLTYGANVCAKDEDGCTPIHTAYYSLNGSYEMVHSVMAVHQGKMINIKDKHGLSIFHIACAVGDTTAVENFIERNVDINASVGLNFGELSGFTGLHFAALNYQEDVIKVLLKHKANVNAVDKNGRSTIWLAVKLVINGTLICKLNENLLKNKSSYDEANVTEEEVMNFMYKEVRKIPIVKLLAENWSNLNRPDEKGNQLLFKAFQPDILWEVIDNIPNKNFIESICRQYNSACCKKVLKILIENDIDFYARDKNYNSILHLVALDCENDENLEIPRMLLTKDFNPNVKNKENTTVLHLAAWHGLVEYAKLLLQYKADPNCIDECLATPLHYAAGKSCTNDHRVESPHAKIVRLLIDNGADVNARNTHGCTPLFASVHDPRTTKELIYLLKANCQVNICSNDGKSPLLVAAKAKNPFAVKLLLDYGADINLNCNKKYGLLQRIYAECTADDFYDIVVETFKVLEIHIEKLILINYPVSNSDLLYRKAMGTMLANGIFLDISSTLDFLTGTTNYQVVAKLLGGSHYITHMLQAELEKMKDIKIDRYTSLYNILFKTDILMVKHVKNEIFIEYLEEYTLHVEFQHYGFLLKLKYKQGMERYVLLEPAKELFRQLIGLDLPDLCLDGIFLGLSNTDLENLSNVCV